MTKLSTHEVLHLLSMRDDDGNFVFSDHVLDQFLDGVAIKLAKVVDPSNLPAALRERLRRIATEIGAGDQPLASLGDRFDAYLAAASPSPELVAGLQELRERAERRRSLLRIRRPRRGDS